MKAKFVLETLNENIGGGGAGYAVWGGGTGRNFGQPSMGGRFTGRGFGFGGGSNLSGKTNIMYTYDVKPLGNELQQPATPQDDNEYIHVGSKIKGNILNTNKKLEGQIIHIEEDEENNIMYYVVLDKQGNKRKIDPTSAFLVDIEQLPDQNAIDLVANENYSRFLAKLNESDEDVDDEDINDEILSTIESGFYNAREFREDYRKYKFDENMSIRNMDGKKYLVLNMVPTTNYRKKLSKTVEEEYPEGYFKSVAETIVDIFHDERCVYEGLQDIGYHLPWGIEENDIFVERIDKYSANVLIRLYEMDDDD